MELNPLKAKLTAKRQELMRLDRERVILVAQIEAYEDAFRLLDVPLEAADMLVDAAGLGDVRPIPRVQRRPLSKMWARILRSLSQFDFDYDDIMSASERMQLGVLRNVARSQMNNYQRAGLVEARPGKKFRVTEAGVKAAQSALEMEGAPEVTIGPNGSSEQSDQ